MFKPKIIKLNGLNRRFKKTEKKLEEELYFIHTLIETIPNPIFYRDCNLVYKHCNSAFYKFKGFSREDVINHTVYDVNPKHIADIYKESDELIIKTKGRQIYQSQITTKDGSIRDVIFSKAAVLDKNNNAIGVVGVITDITEKVKTENRLLKFSQMQHAVLEINNLILKKTSLSELYDFTLNIVRQIMDNADAGCILLSEDNVLRIAASAGYKKEEAEQYSMRLEESFQWKKTNGIIDSTIIINDIEKFSEEHCFKTLLKTENGMAVKSTISAPVIIDGKLYGMLNIDSTKNNVFDDFDRTMMEFLRSQLSIAISKFKLYENIISLSEHDYLTGVFNRRHFENLFDAFAKKALRYGENFLIAIFDLNGLKSINDTYGHLAGDEIILQFADAASHWMRKSDIFARYGGDEFIAMLFNTDKDHAVSKFESLREFLASNPIRFDNNEIICSFSYGIAEFQKDGVDYDELVKKADVNMYAYKNMLKEQK